LFAAKRSVDSLWQELALNFYPERADFTTQRNVGDEFANHLFSSYPVLARRELGNMMAEFLRPDKWMSIHVDDDELDEGDSERIFLEHLSKIQMRAFSDPIANFVTTSAQADHDLVTFGNAIIQGTVNKNGNGLLFKNHHLRDCAWAENADGEIDCLHREWLPTARHLRDMFKEKVSSDVKKACEKEPHKTFKCRHVVMPSRLYEYKSKFGKTFPFISIYIELDTNTVLEEVGLNHFSYVVPRWQIVSGTQYGTSMATAVILPDGRTLQVIKRTMREAAEKFVDPPMLAVTDAIRGDIALYAGGITTADMEYDERLGEVLRPITRDGGGMPVGFEIEKAIKEDIRSGFFLDKMQLPESRGEMTATEVRRRIQEHIRAAAPISKPIQNNYNDPLCQLVFNLLSENGAFPMQYMPESLSDRELKFKFRSPLDELAEQTDADVYVDVMTRIVMPAAQIDPSQMENVDITQATRDAMRASGWKAKWFKPVEAVAQKRAEVQQEAEAQKAMAEAMSLGQAVEQGGKGADSLMKADQTAGAMTLQ
jgi:hypothetical protein